MSVSKTLAALCCLAVVTGAAYGQGKRPAVLGNFDARDSQTAAQPEAGAPEDQALASRKGVRARLTKAASGRVKLLAGDEALTAASTQNRERIVRDFLKSEPGVFSFLPQDPERLRLLASDDAGGLSVLHFQQHIAGLPVYEGTMKAGLSAKGELLRIDGGHLMPELNVNLQAAISAPDAIAAAYRANRMTAPGAVGKAAGEVNGREVYQVANGPDVAVEKTVFPLNDTTGRLAYRMFIEVSKDAFYEMVIDARDGRLLLRRNLVRRAQARVWKESPLKGARELVTLADGWVNADITTGNNVDTYLDVNGDGRADTTVISGLQNGRAQAASQVFDFAAPEASGLDPRGFRPASVTNLFYLVNVAHDLFYSLGFTESAGNFQTSNFSRGGLGNDAVIARAQAGDSADNASFATLPDGLPGVMRMGIFSSPTSTAATESRDAAYDGTVVLHEYTHGVSDRLVGGPSNTSCLFGTQSGAMSEGWSDYFAISYYNNPIEGAYASQSVLGFRRQSYETYTYTYADLGNQFYEVHNDGEIWAATLWDLRKTIGSADTTDKLVLAALKLTPCNPSMVDARDAVIQADQSLNGGANATKLWTVFARHGLGFSAKGVDAPERVGPLHYTLLHLAAFDLPPSLQTGNRPPVISAGLPPVARVGVPYTYQVQASDPEGGVLTYALVSGPSGATVNATSGLLQWTPQFTTQRTQISVTDPQGARAILTFLLPVETPLGAGAVLNISGARDSAGFATFDVPANTPAFQVFIAAIAGDPDIFLADPDGDYVDYESRTGLYEGVLISNPAPGRWTIGVDGYRAYSGTLTAFFPPVTPLTAGVPQTASGVAASQKIFKINLPPYASQLTIQTAGGSGDVDVYISRGIIPACQNPATSDYCVYDVAGTRLGTTENLALNNPGPGDWYITLTGYRDYTDVALTANYTAPVGLLPSQGELVFNVAVGTSAAPRSVIVGADSTVASFQWTATGATSSGGNWLQLSPASGEKGGVLTVTAATASLAKGTYRGNITINAPGVAGSPRTIPVTVVVSAAQVNAPVITEVVNGASFTPGIAPGAWFTIRGTSLASSLRLWGLPDFNGNFLPTALDNVRVKVNGKDALVYYISPTQINALAPDDAITGPVVVTVTNTLGTTTASAQVAVFSPAFFQFDPQNRKYLAAVLPEGTLAGPAGLFGAGVTTKPVAPGGRVLLYATGLGPTNPATAPDQIFSGAAPVLAASSVTVTIGGVNATVEFAGLVSNGLYQLNVVVPNVADGDQQVIVRAGGVSSPAGGFLNVKR